MLNAPGDLNGGVTTLLSLVPIGPVSFLLLLSHFRRGFGKAGRCASNIDNTRSN